MVFVFLHFLVYHMHTTNVSPNSFSYVNFLWAYSNIPDSLSALSDWTNVSSLLTCPLSLTYLYFSLQPAVIVESPLPPSHHRRAVSFCHSPKFGPLFPRFHNFLLLWTSSFILPIQMLQIFPGKKAMSGKFYVTRCLYPHTSFRLWLGIKFQVWSVFFSPLS